MKIPKFYLLISVTFVLIVVLLIYFAYADREIYVELEESSFTINEDKSSPIEEAVMVKDEQVSKTIFIDVKGAVRMEGVYEMNVGARVHEALVVAGGSTDEADLNQVNLAAVLHDEMVIYVPKIGEEKIVYTPQSTKDGKIRINSADLAEIESLPGIGPSKALAILEYRNKNGPFKSFDDLLNIKGIGEKSLAELSDKIILQ